MKSNLSILMLLTGLVIHAGGPRSEFMAGRACYLDGEFKKAVSHFQLALQGNPEDAEIRYWIGMSYQILADISAPFDGKYRSKARSNLTRAVELAPGRRDYRAGLFDYLVDPGNSSRDMLRQAAELLRGIPESDDDYISMRTRLEQEAKLRASAEARLGRFFLLVPRAAYGVAELPAYALSGRQWRERQAPAGR